MVALNVKLLLGASSLSLPWLGDQWLVAVPLVVCMGDGSGEVVLCLRDLGLAMSLAALMSF